MTRGLWKSGRPWWLPDVLGSPVYDETVTRAQTTLLVVLALALTVVGLAPARADETLPDRIAVDTASPEQLDPKSSEGSVTLTGTFTNTTGAELRQVTAQLWEYTGTIATFDAVEAAVDTPGDAPAVVRHEPIQQLVEGDDALAPDERTAFHVEVPISALKVEADEVATVVEVVIEAAQEPEEAQEPEDPAGVEEDTDERVTVGRARVAFPHTTSPFEMTDLDVLTARPAQVPGSQRVSDELQAAIVGPFTQRLVEHADTDTIVVVDPAIVIAAQSVVARGRENVDGAQAFLDALTVVRDDDRLWRLPHGNPDLVRLPEHLRGTLREWSDELAPEGFAELPLTAIVADPTMAEGFDEVLTFGGAEPTRLVRITDEAGPIMLDELQAPRHVSGLPSGDDWPRVDEALAAIHAKDALREELTTDPAGQSKPVDLRPLELAAYSSNWSTEDDALQHLTDSPSAQLDPTKITFTASPAFVMGERTSEFPATITNGSTTGVYVRVVFVSDNPMRINVPDTDFVRVGPGESLTLRVQPQATSNGVTEVRAQLEGPEGTPLGEPVDIKITASEFGRVGWIIVIVSGAVVLGGTVWRIRTVRKEQPAKEDREPGQ